MAKGSPGYFDRYSDRLSVKGWRVERKVAKGILNAVSIRYLMLPGLYRQNERGGFDCDAQELLEVSIVTIPGNARALRAKALDGEGGDIVEGIANRVVELLDARESEGPRRRERQPDREA